MYVRLCVQSFYGVNKVYHIARSFGVELYLALGEYKLGFLILILPALFIALKGLGA